MNKEIPKLINKLFDLKDQIELINKQISLIREKCNHVIVPSHPEFLDISVGICSECGYNTKQWYCPKNPPDYVCEYLLYGEYCIHCEQPDERK